MMREQNALKLQIHITAPLDLCPLLFLATREVAWVHFCCLVGEPAVTPEGGQSASVDRASRRNFFVAEVVVGVVVLVRLHKVVVGDELAGLNLVVLVLVEPVAQERESVLVELGSTLTEVERDDTHDGRTDLGHTLGDLFTGDADAATAGVLAGTLADPCAEADRLHAQRGTVRVDGLAGVTLSGRDVEVRDNELVVQHLLCSLVESGLDVIGL